MGRSMIFLVSGFLIIFGIIQQSVQNRQRVLAERAPEYYYQEQSRNIAGAMLEVALGNINSGNNYLPQNAENSIKGKSIDMMGGTGTVKSVISSRFNTRFEVEITGEIEKPDGSTALTTIDAVFNRKAFSIYAYFTHQEKTAGGSDIFWYDDDVINGPLHTNGKLRIGGDPTFNGPVTTHNGKFERSHSNPQFNDSKDFDAPEVPLPTETPEVTELAKTTNGGIGKFDDDIYVEFKDDDSDNNTGTVEISEVVYGCVAKYTNGACKRYDYKPDTNTTSYYNLSDFNGVISSKKKVYVQGKVDGQATVHSEEEIKIMGDIYYENRTTDKADVDDDNPLSDDLLGLVSEYDTIVDNDAHSTNGSEDLYIDASILSINGSFKVQDYYSYGYRGNLNILGGLIQRVRGAVGTFGSYGVTGYSKNYNYDTRFLEGSTPGFPRKQKFEIENWRESTRTIKIDE